MGKRIFLEEIMKKKILTGLVMVLLIFGGANIANATLFDLGNSTFIDSKTGYQWYDIHLMNELTSNVMLSYNDISNPDNASMKYEVEFKSPDILVQTTIVNNKTVKIDTMTRVK